MKLLVHHHAIAYKDSDGIWIHSTMGSWITHLADHFEEVGLLLHVTEDKKPVQDTCIINENVILHSLGPPGRMWDKIQRTLRIRKACAELDNKYDTLLIRGITPRQHIVWNNIKVNTLKKYFLLVGSPIYGYSIASIRTLPDLYYWYMERYRIFELNSILRNGTLLVNAPTLVEEAFDVLKEKSLYIPTNTISEVEFIPFSPKQINSDRIKLLFVGRVIRAKGVIEAIESVKLLIESGYDCELNVVGPIGGGSFKTELENIRQQLSLETKVNFHGLIEFGDKLLNMYRTADIFILPSYNEGFPHVIWEAAASCCPIITSPAGGIPSLFKHRQHAVLIPPKDHKVLADSIIELLDDERLRTNIVTNAYNFAMEYTAESCAKKLAEVILSKNEKQ